jgi:hypothetical protein
MQQMKKLLAPAAFLFLTAAACAQSPCALVSIEQIRYAATDAGMVEVLVNNQSGEFFSYPSFLLIGTSGDTLAQEQVNFFGLGQGIQAHYLEIRNGVDLSLPFPATLVLSGNFGDVVHCSWDFTDVELCPADECVNAEIYIMDMGTLEAFDVPWWIVHTGTGAMVATGTISMDGVQSMHFGSTCLPPGQYVIGLSPFTPITTQHVVGITSNSMHSIGTNTLEQQDPTPLDLAFGWYSICAAITNSVTTATTTGQVIVALDHGMLVVRAQGHERLGRVELWSTEGRLLARQDVPGTDILFPVHDLATGMVLVRLERPTGTPEVRRIIIP